MSAPDRLSAVPGPRRLRRLREARSRRMPDLLAGFWFLTSLVALCGPLLALLVIWIDKSAGHAGAFPALIISPDSARTILGSISGSLITIASLTSSLTIVTLQLLSSQYTPRTVRGFLSTRFSQVVLGSFIAIFLYCLLLLVAVREPGDENAPFVPSLGVVVSVLLAVGGLIALVVFIHAMSQTIQVSTMSARVATDTHLAIGLVHDGVDAGTGHLPGELAEVVRGGVAGYVRDVDLDGLLTTMRHVPGSRVRIYVRPGDFVTPRTALACAEPDVPSLADAIRRAVFVERERDLRGDPAYGIRQLVDIALRALSPGINDPSTAITCLGYLRALLEELAARPLPAERTVTKAGATITAAALEFDDYLSPVVEIAGYAGSDARVVWTLLDALESVAGCADAERAAGVRAVCAEIKSAALDDARLPSDRARLDDQASR